jgi:SAM-dependent methyltransferase
MTESSRSRAFWDNAARRNAAWYVATGHVQETDEFFQQGATEADAFLTFCGVEPKSDATVLEIGCGVGRMTRRLAGLFGRVVAVDVSQEMLRRCRANLASFPNVTYRLVDGDGSLDCVGDGEVDVVFSYITFQHVPTRAAQLRYFGECARVLRHGGKLAIQIRSSAPAAVALSYVGHLAHLAQGRRTMSRSWRGSRLRASAVVECLRERGVTAVTRSWVHRARFSPAQWWVVGTKG